MGLMNCQSASKNGDSIKDYILEQDLDLAALTETWMVGGDADNVVKSKLIPNGYRMQHVPRIGCGSHLEGTLCSEIGTSISGIILRINSHACYYWI